MSDGAFYDVHMTVPVTARVWAESEAQAKLALVLAKVSVAIDGTYSIGLAEHVEATEIEEPEPRLRVIK